MHFVEIEYTKPDRSKVITTVSVDGESLPNHLAIYRAIQQAGLDAITYKVLRFLDSRFQPVKKLWR